jgi:predicted N-acetyltransferase YhbS
MMNIHFIPVSASPLDHDYCVLPGDPTYYQCLGFEADEFAGVST